MNKENLQIAQFKKLTTEQMLNLVKEPSSGLYYTVEHLRKRGIPRLVREQEKLDTIISTEDDLKIDCQLVQETMEMFPAAAERFDSIIRKLESRLDRLKHLKK
jgi:hypothetical protein